MSVVINRKAPKKPTNVSINSELLQRARELKVNVSAVLEQALEETINRRLREQWLAENRDAFAQYNEHVEKNGVYSDDERGF
jgi:antitoxin CcdA